MEGQKSTQRVVPQVSPQKFDPRALLNPRSLSKLNPQPEIVEIGNGEQRGRNVIQGPGPGMGSQVERLHNVYARAEQSPKRPRVEDEEQRKKPKLGPMGAGDLMASLRPSLTAQPAQLNNNVTIDLTDTVDDEPVTMKDPSEEIICIGRLKKAYIQTHMVPFQSPAKHTGNQNTQARIKVRFRRMGSHRGNLIISALDPSASEFGRVDMKTASGLAPLMDAAGQSRLRWAAMTEPRKKAKGEGPAGSPLSTLIAVTIQLYCPRKTALSVGKYLRTRTMFLDDPIFDRDRYPYFNPQTMAQYPGPQAAGTSYTHGQSQHTPAGYAIRSVDEIRNDVNQMFSTIINSKDLPEREQDHRIMTPLLKHQKQALCFMMDREKERSGEEEQDLFRLRSKGNGQKYWFHVITGHESLQKPPSALGGILADEMGLGKTLSILSLVVDSASLQAAEQFAQQPSPSSYLRNNRGTLLVCPVSTMSNWEDQLNTHVAPGTVSWYIYHGPRRAESPEELDGYDIVLTTYSTVAAEYQRGKPLERTNWFRIVLDEAHSIRTQKTKQSQSICALSAERRWAVTGTPVQNRLEDLGALFKFLRVAPFHEASGFNEYILTPFKNADPDVVPKLQLLVSSLTLRRLKHGLVDLPPRRDLVVRLKFSRDEQTLHDWFEKDSARQVNAVTAGEKLGGTAYARILGAILNLRLICAHGQELLSDEAMKTTEGISWDNAIDLGDDEDEGPPVLTRKQAYEMLDLLQETDTDKCQICDAKISQEPSDADDEDEEKPSNTLGFMTACYHIICPKCVGRFQAQLDQNASAEGHVTCQFCDQQIRSSLYELKVDELETVLADRERMRKDPKLAKKLNRYTGPHTKTKALLADLQQSKLWSEAHLDEAPIKSVVFSCWTTHLDLISIALDAHGFKYTRLDGRMKRIARSQALDTFSKDPSVPIMLVSIGAGGLGLNLTVANKAYVMEPQFNPAAEAQAVDRVHRLGQTREVTITRYIMENSFEEKMLELQRKKRALADLTMARERVSRSDMAKQRLEELRSLFK
jgi:SNF2 family DNA or RNA helicase